MSLTKEEILAFVEENILLSKVNGKIVIRVIKTDVGMVAGSVSWVYGHVGRAGSVGLADRHVGKSTSVDWVGSVEWAASVGDVGNEENES